jgi:microtubule-associated protein-like 6
LTVHPNGKYVATGQIGKEPYICVWDATTMETVSLLKGFHSRGISSMGFSNDGKFLVSVGLDDDHDMALWEWETGRLVSHEKTSKERVFDIQLSPYAPLAVTSGVKHINVNNYFIKLKNYSSTNILEIP